VAQLFFDIETIPTTNAELQRLVDSYNEIEPKMSFEQYFRMTALSGEWGRILCIGYAIDRNPVEILIGQEAEQLRQFWQLGQSADLFVGHNIFHFDLPFIHRRSMFHQVQPSLDFTSDEHRQKIFDTLHHFRPLTKGRANLDAAAKYFGIPSSKAKLHGRLVWDYYKMERHDEIYDYCKKDVEVTREIFWRLAPVKQSYGSRLI
jgi:predicted PolB exonuclease-like 3'-5' exonuclease